jgi:hypothetical protein
MPKIISTELSAYIEPCANQSLPITPNFVISFHDNETTSGAVMRWVQYEGVIGA